MLTPSASRSRPAQCNICGGSSFSPLQVRSDGISVVSCDRCGMGVVERIPSDPTVFYGDGYYAADGETVGYGEYAAVAEHGVSWSAALVKILRKSGKVLDIGCVDGHLLRKLGTGFETYGIEVNPHMAERAAAAGVTVIAHDIFDRRLGEQFAGRFDIVTAIAVFEHVSDFKRAFETAMSLLAEDGVLIFEVPVISTTVANDTWFRSSLEHIYYPTEGSLRWLAERTFRHVLVGREVEISGYAAVYVGLVAKSRSHASALETVFARLLDTPVAGLAPDERDARVLFSLIHAAQMLPDTIGALSAFPVAQMTQPLLVRIASLWQLQANQLEAARRQLHRPEHRAAAALRSPRRSGMTLLRRSMRLAQRIRANARGRRSGRDDEPDDSAAPGVGPGPLRRLRTLVANANVDRLRSGLRLVMRGDIYRLAVLVKLHTEFRWRLRARPPPIQEPATSVSFGGPEVVIAESPWPEHSPLVSVVVTCFNYGKFVAEAIDSVLAQTFRDLEVIVVEGGSTDGTTRDVVAALERPRTRFLFRAEPHRTGDNRNFGIAQARGKYVCCLDADDMLRPTYLEKALFLLEVYGFDVVSTSIRKFGLADDAVRLIPSPQLADMIESNHVATCAVFRRALWEQAGGYRDAAPGTPYLYEDWQFWMRLAAMGARIANITGEQLFLYRIHRLGSISSNPGLLSLDAQRPLINEANADVVTREAIKNSRACARQRRRSADGARNLRRETGGARSGLTVLLAVPFLIVGGAEKILSDVVGHLARMGHRVIIVSTLPFGDEYGDSSAAFEGATSEIYHLPRFLVPERWRDFVDYLIEAKGVDVLWIAGSAYFYAALPYLKNRYPHLRVADQLFNAVGHAANNRKYAAYIDLNLVENAEVDKWLRGQGEATDRIKMIPSGVDVASFAPRAKPRSLLAALNFDADAFIVGFSGRLAEEKAPLSFVRIAAAVAADAPIRFVMTGGGPLEGQVREEIKRLKLGDRFRFAGIVADVREYLACYDALVLPSAIDGRPVVVMEALAMGIPVIASRVGGIPEMVADGDTGFLCDSRDISAFASSIRALQADPQRHAGMRQAARRFAEEHLDADTMKRRYELALVDLVGGPAAHVGPAPRGLMDVA
jgi:glycosyltransferase involved in cell wall biosynthesis/SAM-dependent methyltransferase